MAAQLHKRLSRSFVEEILEAFNDHRNSEVKACQLLGLRRARLYELRERWLQCLIGKKPFALYGRRESGFHRLPGEEERWHHEELAFIQRKAVVHRGRFNFAVLAEEAEKAFGHSFARATIRAFALRHGYYHARPEEKEKVFVRFETPGSGFLYQHDCSEHRWVPALDRSQHLILTKDDYSRLFVEAHLFEKEGSYEHLRVVRAAAERYGRPEAYYVDQHKIFRVVEHHGVHVWYHLGLDEAEIKFKRALRSIDVGLIYTAEGSPESKGKVEKSFDYLQRRIPYLCERHKARDLVEARKIVTDVVGFYNEDRVHLETEKVPRKRWDEALRAGRGKLRTLGPARNLDLIFSLHYERTVKKDGTFCFQGKEYKLRHLAATRATIGLIPKTKLLVIRDGQRAADFPL